MDKQAPNSLENMVFPKKYANVRLYSQRIDV